MCHRKAFKEKDYNKAIEKAESGIDTLKEDEGKDEWTQEAEEVKFELLVCVAESQDAIFEGMQANDFGIQGFNAHHKAEDYVHEALKSVSKLGKVARKNTEQ